MKFRFYFTEIRSVLIQSPFTSCQIDTSLSVDHLNVVLDSASIQILKSDNSSVFKVTSCPEIESFVKNFLMPGAFISLCARGRLFFSNIFLLVAVFGI